MNFTPGASRSNFDKAATKQRNKDIAADIKAKQAQKGSEAKPTTKRV